MTLDVATLMLISAITPFGLGILMANGIGA